MPTNLAAVQPDLPITEAFSGRYVWDEFDPPIVIHLFADGRIMVNGDEVKGRPEFDGRQRAPIPRAEDEPPRCAEDEPAPSDRPTS